jgi:hypothetical protein
MVERKEMYGISVGGIPLDKVIEDQRDKRIIKIRDQEVIVSLKRKKKPPIKKPPWRQNQRIKSKDSKPSKVRYLTKREIEEEAMEKEIKKIDREGLTVAESIYLAFKENEWKGLRSAQIGHAIGKPPNNTSALVSVMKKNGMLVMEEREHNKFYYSVSEDCQELGRVGWGNMFREIQNRVRHERKAKTKQRVGKDVGGGPEKVKDETPLAFGSAQKLAADVRKHTGNLDAAIEDARLAGLQVDLKTEDGALKVKVYKEF